MADARDATTYVEVIAQSIAEARDAATYVEVAASTTPAVEAAAVYIEILIPVSQTTVTGWGTPV